MNSTPPNASFSSAPIKPGAAQTAPAAASAATASDTTSDEELRPFPLPRQRLARLQAVITRAVLNEIHAHGLTDTKVEIGGVLVGRLCRDEHGQFLSIDASIRGTRAASHAAQVTFTADTWTQIQDTMDRDYPDRRIVGWYHTHPGFGVFLSEMDMFIQRNFFDLPWQVALVHDPLRREDGLFVWRDDQTQRESLLIDEQTGAPAPPATPSKPTTTPPSKPQPAPTLDVPTQETILLRLEEVERRQWATIVLLVLFMIAAVAWPLLLAKFRDAAPMPSPHGAVTQPATAPR